MIVIRIDLWPWGDSYYSKRIGEIHIINDGTGTKQIGNYITRLYTKHKKPRLWKQGEVKNFPRLRLGVYDLLYRCLHQLIKDRN